jgi:small subunit ribosomal protein S9
MPKFPSISNSQLLRKSLGLHSHRKMSKNFVQKKKIPEDIQGLELTKLTNNWYRFFQQEEALRFLPKQVNIQQKVTYEREVNAQGWANGTGRRKTASAQVWIQAGDGLDMEIKKNGDEKWRMFVEYFTPSVLEKALEPLRVCSQFGQFNVRTIVQGGGVSGQAGAISLGLARALQAFDPTHRTALKAAGLLTRDARIVERKKPGQKKARKKFQWVKR